MSFTHRCSACEEDLPPKHLRVQMSLPDQPWRMLRLHDLQCLLDWAEDEDDGTRRELFTRPEWVDSRAGPRA